MTVAEKSSLKTADIKPKIGTKIFADKKTLLSGIHTAELRDLLEQRGVLVFPKINFTDEEQVAFTSTLGTFARDVGAGDVYNISMGENKEESADYLRGAFYWHIDGTMSPMPILASLLSSKVLATSGGNTEFSNTYAAYDDLPEEEMKALEDARVVHALSASMLFPYPEATYEQFKQWRSVGTKKLPLVWTHRSGRKSLVLGCTADHVVGMDPIEGRDLLIRLRDWATQPEYVYSHEWSVGDAVMWDNTGTMHRAMPYPLDCGRELHRTKLEGEEPIAA